MLFTWSKYLPVNCQTLLAYTESEDTDWRSWDSRNWNFLYPLPNRYSIVKETRWSLTGTKHKAFHLVVLVQKGGWISKWLFGEGQQPLAHQGFICRPLLSQSRVPALIAAGIGLEGSGCIICKWLSKRGTGNGLEIVSLAPEPERNPLLCLQLSGTKWGQGRE